MNIGGNKKASPSPLMRCGSSRGEKVFGEIFFYHITTLCIQNSHQHDQTPIIKRRFSSLSKMKCFSLHFVDFYAMLIFNKCAFSEIIYYFLIFRTRNSISCFENKAYKSVGTKGQRILCIVQ